MPEPYELLTLHLEKYQVYNARAIAARADVVPEWEDLRQTADHVRKGAEAIIAKYFPDKTIEDFLCPDA